MSIKTTENIPSAKRLMESMRSVGYRFENAVADIVDNSIASGATKIFIEPKFSGNKSYLLISDNGKGMNLDELNEAMRFGSEGDYESSSLGRFGLGLKTSSLSQCRAFIVASTSEHDGSGISLASWDFDYIKSENKWKIIHPSMDDIYSKLCCKHLKNKTQGTAVLWRRLDTLFQGFKDTESGHAVRHFVSKCRDTEEHLAMVFHRFLSGECEGETIEIVFSGNSIKPWNPFALDYGGKAETWELKQKSLEVAPSKSKVEYKGFVLPSQREFDTKKDFDIYAGPKKWNRQQGFYVYRAGRMIQSGGWSGIRVVDEHTKLARASLSFPPGLDSQFQIDIGKMKISLPPEFRDELKRITQPLVGTAKERYKKGGNPLPPSPPPPPPEPKYTLGQVRNMLAMVSDGDELPVINRVFKKLLSEKEK